MYIEYTLLGEHYGQSYFLKNGFALRLALKQRAQGNSEIANLRKSKITKKGGGGKGVREQRDSPHVPFRSRPYVLAARSWANLGLYGACSLNEKHLREVMLRYDFYFLILK